MSIKHVNTIAALLLALILVLPGVSAAAGEDNKEIATVNGTAITQDKLDGEMGRLKTMLMQRGHMPTEADLASLKKVAINSLVEQELLYQASQKKNIKIDDAVLNEQFEKLKGRFPDEKAFNDTLTKMNLTPEVLKEQLARSQYIQNYINQEFVEKVSVSDDDVKKFYDEHPDAFKQPETIKVSHILVSVDPKAEEKDKKEAKDKLEKMKKEIADGADFAELATKNSDCPSKEKGGDLGFISRDQVVEPFAKAAFALKTGDVSDIVETQYGYHLIKAFEHKDASVTPMAEVKDKIASYLKQETVKKELETSMEAMKNSSKIEILDPELKEEPKS